MVIIGVLQFWIYVRQARILSKQTTIASDTLGFLSTQERPYVLVADLKTAVLKRTAEARGHDVEVIASLINAGKTPAIVHSIEFDGPTYEKLDAPPVYMSVYSVHSIVVTGDKPLRFGFSVNGSSPYSLAPLFFYIRVHYVDVFGRFRATAFAFRLDRHQSRIGGRAFNYDHREKDDPAYWPGEKGISPPFLYRLWQETRIIWLWLRNRV